MLANHRHHDLVLVNRSNLISPFRATHSSTDNINLRYIPETRTTLHHRKEWQYTTYVQMLVSPIYPISFLLNQNCANLFRTGIHDSLYNLSFEVIWGFHFLCRPWEATDGLQAKNIFIFGSFDLE